MPLHEGEGDHRLLAKEGESVLDYVERLAREKQLLPVGAPPAAKPMPQIPLFRDPGEEG